MGRTRIRDHVVKLPVSDAMHLALRSEARALGVSMAGLVRSLIAEHLKQANKLRSNA